MSGARAEPAGGVTATGPLISVVGIGAEGWAGLGEPARAAILSADTIVGSRRQLALVPDTPAERRPWPSPIDALVDEIVAGLGGCVCVLASGDPMLHGIGATLARRLGPSRLAVHPHPSAFALACARLGWPEAEVELVSAVGRPPEVIAPALQAGRRIVAYATGTDGAATVARVLRARGFGPSRFVVLERLGGDTERIVDTTAVEWGDAQADPLHAVAIECRGAPGHGRTPGLPDDAYDTDGALTKWPVRAVTLAALRPGAHQLLWDVGAGSGSIAIEWLRAEPLARAVAIESRAERAARIAANALCLGVPGLLIAAGSGSGRPGATPPGALTVVTAEGSAPDRPRATPPGALTVVTAEGSAPDRPRATPPGALIVVTGAAPAALAGLDPPDAIFVGGGLSVPGVLDACWAALRAGGRLVANAVTLEGEQALHAARAAHGGTLTRLAVSHAEPLGGFEAWRAQIPVVQWSVVR